MRDVKITPEFSRAFRGLGLPREASITLWNRLHEQLRNNPGLYTRDRDAARPDTHFLYKYALYIEGRWRRFVFSVCDSISPDFLIVETVVAA